MLENIAFIGGIHGVGKSTICEQLCQKTDFKYLSASKVINWKEINTDNGNKKVKDVSVTQDRLIEGLSNIIEKNKFYLLDGHYCLINVENHIVNIPIQTFKDINPISFNLIVGDIDEIKKRLEERDNKNYNYDLLEKMQESELNYAKSLSSTLNIPLNIGTQNDILTILTSLQKSQAIR